LEIQFLIYVLLFYAHFFRNTTRAYNKTLLCIVSHDKQLVEYFFCSSISILSKTSALVDAACVMATQIPVTSQILMTRTNCCAVVNTTHAVATVTLAVLATSRRHGGSQKVTSLLYVNVSTFCSLFVF